MFALYPHGCEISCVQLDADDAGWKDLESEAGHLTNFNDIICICYKGKYFCLCFRRVYRYYCDYALVFVMPIVVCHCM